MLSSDGRIFTKRAVRENSQKTNLLSRQTSTNVCKQWEINWNFLILKQISKRNMEISFTLWCYFESSEEIIFTMARACLNFSIFWLLTFWQFTLHQNSPPSYRCPSGVGFGAEFLGRSRGPSVKGSSAFVSNQCVSGCIITVFACRLGNLLSVGENLGRKKHTGKIGNEMKMMEKRFCSTCRFCFVSSFYCFCFLVLSELDLG